MSKVQVDTIVDKDDISAPTLSKGAIVTGVCTATTFVGAVTGNVTGNADTATTATTATNAQGLTGSPNITVTDVNATGVTTTGIGTVTTSVVVGSAVTANSDGVITSGIITATSFSGSGANLTGITQTTINNNANNRLISGSGTANTLEAESQVTYDGTILQLRKNGAGEYNEIITDGNPSTDRGTLGLLSGYWDGDRVADIIFSAGDDTSNKNNGIIQFRTTQEGGGSCTPRLQIGSMGQIGVPVGPVGTAATDYGTSGQVLTSGGGSASPTWATPSGGAWEVVSTQLFDGSMTDGFTDLKNWSNSYAQYKVILQNVNFSSGVVVWFRVFTDNTTGANGTLNSSADYMYGAAFGSTQSSGGWNSSASSSQNQHVLAGDNAYSTWNGEYTFPMNPSNGTHEHVWIGQSYVDSNGFWFYDNGSTSNSDNHLTGVRIFWDGGSAGVPQNGRLTLLRMKYS